MQTDLFVWGYARRVEPGQVLFELHLFARGEPERYTELPLSDTLTDPSNALLQRQVHSALTGLVTRGGVATVRLHVGNSSGQVLLDGHPATDLRNGLAVVSLRAGEHRIEVRLPGDFAATRTVFVQPGSVTDLQLDPPASGSADNPSAPPTNWHRTGGAIGIGAGVVFAGLGLWSSLTVMSVNDDRGFQAYKSGVGANSTHSTDVCDAANAGVTSSYPGAASPSQVSDMCSSASLHEKLAVVFYGSALVSAGVGIYLLASNPKSQPTGRPHALQLVPSVGKQSAGLTASIGF